MSVDKSSIKASLLSDILKPIWSDLVSAYLFDETEGDIITDYSENEYDMTISGTNLGSGGSHAWVNGGLEVTCDHTAGAWTSYYFSKAYPESFSQDKRTALAVFSCDSGTVADTGSAQVSTGTASLLVLNRAFEEAGEVCIAELGYSSDGGVAADDALIAYLIDGSNHRLLADGV